MHITVLIHITRSNSDELLRQYVLFSQILEAVWRKQLQNWWFISVAHSKDWEVSHLYNFSTFIPVKEKQPLIRNLAGKYHFYLLY